MIPNIITTVRLGLIPLFVYFMLGKHNYIIAALIFVACGALDVLDGFIARKFKMGTDFGKIYDPFVDKLVQITALVCLVLEHLIPVWLLIIVCVKEGLMILVGGILYLKNIVVHSNWYGKACTVLFYIIVFAIIVWTKISGGIPAPWLTGLCVVMVLAMVCSAVAYFVDIVKHYDEKRVG